MALWGVTVSPASGQIPFRSSDGLEKTDQAIEKAKQAVAESGSNRARALVQNAITLQERAWDHFRKRIYQQARRFTVKAREKAYEALAATRGPEENENAVRRQLERTDEILHNLAERIGRWRHPGPSMGPGAAQSQLESLLHRQKTAWQHFHEYRLRAALKLTLRIREQATRLTEQTRRFRHGWTDVEHSVERLHQFLERARNPIVKSEAKKNIELFDRAERRFAQAEDALKDGQVSVAREHLKICRELLRRALAGIERSADPGQARELIEKAQERWDRLEGAVIDSGDQGFRDMYRRAGKHLKRAQSMLRQQKIIRALTQARNGRNPRPAGRKPTLKQK